MPVGSSVDPDLALLASQLTSTVASRKYYSAVMNDMQW